MLAHLFALLQGIALAVSSLGDCGERGRTARALPRGVACRVWGKVALVCRGHVPWTQGTGVPPELPPVSAGHSV